MNEQPPTAVPSTPFRRETEIMRDVHRRLAGGRDAVDVDGLVAGNMLLTLTGLGYGAVRSFQRVSMDLDAARSALAGEIMTAQAETNLNGRFSGARRVITAAGIEALKIQYSNGLSLGDVLLHAVGAPRTPDRRSFAVLVIDALAVDGLIPSTSERPDIDRNVCALAESALREVLDRFKYPFKSQSYEKRRALEGLHASVVELLSPVASPAHDLEGLLVNRSKLTKCLTDGIIEAYFGATSVRHLLGGVQRVFETLSDVRQQEDAGFHAKLRMAQDAVAHLRDLAQGRSGEVADAVARLLAAADHVVSQLVQDTAPLLVSEIGTARPEPRAAAKRYQLHEEGRRTELPWPHAIRRLRRLRSIQRSPAPLVVSTYTTFHTSGRMAF